MASERDISFEPLTKHVGAKVHGVDAGTTLDVNATKVLNEALDRYILLYLGDQSLTERTQTRFARNFGPLGVRRKAPKDSIAGDDDTRGYVMLVTNIPEEANSAAGSYGDGEMWFHADSCYYEVPNRATFLYSVELPSRGGKTCINSMYAAFENVPERLKSRLEGRRALQVHDHKRRERLDLDKIVIEELRHFWQPVFVTHPRTGRRALYVNRLMTACIEGLSRAESDAILEDLFEIAEDPTIGYEHEWQLGDLLIWDNFASIHMRTDFPREERRLLRRCTVGGERRLDF